MIAEQQPILQQQPQQQSRMLPANVPTQPQAAFQSASLYVGDLHSEATEGVLFEMFNRVGPVASIRVCRDAVTRRSLGYAYVNFHNVQDAERALDTMNFTEIRDRPCRIMWSQRDPSLRKSGVGNVFVKNLHPSVDNKGLFDTFSVFGNILSCKVATDAEGISKGYGYVHYETDEAAKDAITKFNGCFIEEMEVFVGPFVRRQDRPRDAKWTNLYFKQIPLHFEESKVLEIFSQFGTIVSCWISRDPDGKSKGFGFINYQEHEAADAALKELTNKSLDDGEGGQFDLYVNRAQKRNERQREIQQKLSAMQLEIVSKYQGLNLYVKNIDDTITDAVFSDTFAKIGTITSARIMREADGASKGFGFVCYSTPEEATRAVQELNGKMLSSKPIFVTLHQRKEQRQAALQASYSNRMRYPTGPAGMPMPYMQMPYQNAGPNAFQMQRFPAYPGAQPFPGRGAGARGNMAYNAGGRGAAAPGYYPMPQYQQQGPPAPMQMGPGQQGQFRRPVAGQQPISMGQGQPQPQQQPRRLPQQAGRGPNPGARPGYPGAIPQQLGPSGAQQQRGPGGPMGVNFKAGVRNQGMLPNGAMVQNVAPVQSLPMLGEPLDDQALAAADPQMQKNMIGERLYPLIFVHQPQLAGKITGMLLEMDNAELLNLIESPDALLHKIEEALTVLKNHQSASEE
jgi:polyadenylate-binding protein